MNSRLDTGATLKPEATVLPSRVMDDEVAELQADLCVLSTDRRANNRSPASAVRYKVIDVPVVMQRQVPAIQTVQKTVEATQAHHVDIPVVLQRRLPIIQRFEKTVEVPQVQHIDRIVDVPVLSQRQVPTIQTGQKTPEVPLSQYHDQVNVLVEIS